MIISDNKIRPIYPQKEINWQKTCSAINVDGYYNFYFSGQFGNDLIFKLKDNKIYSYNDDLIGGFNKNEIINFSGNIANQKLDLYKDEKPLYIGLNRPASGNILGFFVECQNTNFNIESLLINGEQPKYYFDSNITYNSGEQIPIYIRNSGAYPIIIYSGELANTNYYSISGANNLIIPASGTSNFYLINNSVFSNNLEIVNINLFTNVGTESLYINLSGTLIDNTLFYIVLSPPVNTIFDTNRFIYTLTLANASGSDLAVSLEYVSGFTGKYYQPVERSNFQQNKTVSGIISGSGFLYGIGTGLVSGFNTILNQFEFGTGSGLMSTFRVANDQYIERTYNVSGSGIGDVYLSTGVPASGYNYIIYSGYTTYLGGTLTGFSYGPISGIVPDKKASWVPMGNGQLGPAPIDDEILSIICRLQPENCDNVRKSTFRYQYVYGTGSGISFYDYKYTGIVTGFYPVSDLTTVTLNKADVYVTGDFIDKFAITGIVYATGGRKTGIFLGDILDFFEPGYWEVWKMWGGILSGENALLEWTGEQFDPLANQWIPTGVTGYYVGKISGVGGVSICDLEFPALIPSGIPNAVRIFDFKAGQTPPGKTKIYYQQVTGDIIAPAKLGFKYLEWPNENSNFVLQSGNISLHSLHPTGGRTRISRLGNTPSGSGKFDNVFQYPFFEGINEDKFYTGIGGDLLLVTGAPVPLYKYKLNTTGGRIPLYNGYKCQYITGFDGSLIKRPLLCSNGNIDCVNGVCVNGICYDTQKYTNGQPVYDQDGNLVPNRFSYQCEPLRDNNGNIVLQPLMDVSGSIYIESGNSIVKAYVLPWANTGVLAEMFVMEREKFIASTGFFGWLEQIPVLTGRRYFEDYASSITGISGMGAMVNSCDYSYINFNIDGAEGQDVNFNFIGSPQNILIFELYKSGVINPFINKSGGYYITNPKPLDASYFCDPGQYFGVLKFIPEACFMESGLNIGTCLAYSHTIFTGCESNGYLAGKILRKGYTDFKLGLEVVGYFTGPNYKYLSSGVKQSGIRWKLILEPGQAEETFSFPIYKHSSLDQDVFGKFHFNIFSGIENYPFPIDTLGIEDQEASFVIKDMSGACSASIASQGILPINPYETYYTQIGLDFDTAPQTPSLTSWPFECDSLNGNNGGGGNTNTCAGLICPAGYTLDIESCQCAPNITTQSGNNIINAVEVGCTGIPIIISGYAFYRDILQPVSVPGLGSVMPSCAGGHNCDRTLFLPVISFDGGLRYESTSQISLNNYPAGGNRNATFQITIPNSLAITGRKASFELECQSPNNNCHEGVTFVVLTTTVENSTIKLLQQCLAPNTPTNFPILCSGFGCSNNLYQDFSFIEPTNIIGAIYGTTTITNPINEDVGFIMDGTVDDDIVINGIPYGSPNIAAHDFHILSGLKKNQSFTVGVLNNYMGNAAYSFRICWISGSL